MFIRFAFFRLFVLVFVVGSQIYLFTQFRKAVLETDLSARAKSIVVPLVGATICLLFALNILIAARPFSLLFVHEPVRALLFFLPPIWGFGSIFSALVLCLVRLMGWVVTTVRRFPSGPRATSKSPSSAIDEGRRRFLRASVASLAAAPFLASGYGATFGRQSYRVQEMALPFGRTLRVVQLSDIHAGVYMTSTEMRRYADRVIALNPDLFVLTGDFVSNSLAFLPECLEEMARVRPRYGTFACLGNHDNWYGRQRAIRMAFAQHDIRLLINENYVVETPHGPFAVSGIDDLRTGHPDLEASLQNLLPAMPTLLLSHRPEVFPRAAKWGVRLTLSGHWHGGQIKMPLPGMMVSPAHLMTPYPEGLYTIDSCHLYVNRGIGTTFTPIRLNAPPEITVFTLT
jgi:uncharacterized protein